MNTGAILTHLYPPVTAYAARKCRPSIDFESIVQEVLFGFSVEAQVGALACLDHQPIECIRPDRLQLYHAECRSHCYRKVNNKIRALVRRAQRQDTAPVSNMLLDSTAQDGRTPPIATPDVLAIATETQRLVLTEIEKLCSDDREVIYLAYILEFDSEICCEILEVNPGRFAYLKRRAWAVLRERLRYLMPEPIAVAAPRAADDRPEKGDAR